MRVILVVALVAGSGAVRLWQAKRVDAALAAGRESPFPLSTIPITLGDWSGSATELDARIVEATGSTDHITRRYVDRRTGVSLDVIVLYGPTSEIFIHTPELCYPKAGYASDGDSINREIVTPGMKMPVRSVVYKKGDPGQVERQEVYYSWRYNAKWSASVSSPKESEPGMYKVQVSRLAGKFESRTVDNPCEAFLSELLPDLEARITGKVSTQSPSPVPAAEPKKST
jgi:hypothetical protein